ncbi:MAG: polysaccharide deacetylase family protein [Clostridia bacterium]|nr:polysaccharide deacetylase family protein [Clostridia bacterium]
MMILSLLLSFPALLSGCQKNESEANETESGTATPLPPNEEKPTLDPNQKRVAITFDDGPHNVWTKQIVNELGRYGYTATFFVLGNRIDGTAYKGGDTMSFAASQGHEIAIHGYTHEVYYNKCTNEEYNFELSETDKAIRNWGGGTPTLMRPIGGSITTERVDACPYAVIKWDVDSEDWRYKYKSDDTEEARKEKVDTIVQNVMSNVGDGSIILLHDIYESTYDATRIILERLNAEGYAVVSVSELLGEPVPGKLYYSN